MRPASCIAAALLCAASPAFATGTIVCTARGLPGLDIGIVVGHGAAGAVAQATISLGGEEITTGSAENQPRLGQAWIDEDELKLDIVDANVDQRLARLVTRRRGSVYVGTLVFRGQTIRVRCSEEG